MFELKSRYPKEEFARRGKAIYQEKILPLLKASDENKFVVIDIETEQYEMDEDVLSATDRLTARLPDAQPWMERVGHATAFRFGGRGWRGR